MHIDAVSIQLVHVADEKRVNDLAIASNSGRQTCRLSAGPEITMFACPEATICGRPKPSTGEIVFEGQRLNELGVASSGDLPQHAGGERILIAGLVVARQHPATAKGTVFVLLEDEFGYMNVIVPRQLYQENREVVRHAPFLAVEGRFEREDMVMNIVGRRFRELRVGRRSGETINFRSRDFH